MVIYIVLYTAILTGGFNTGKSYSESRIHFVRKLGTVRVLINQWELSLSVRSPDLLTNIPTGEKENGRKYSLLCACA